MPDEYSSQTHNAIRERAQQYYEEEGRPEGRDMDHWLKAEGEIRAEQNSRDPNTEVPAATPETSASSGEELS